MKFIMQTLRQGHLMCFLFLLCTLSPSPATPLLSQSFEFQSVCHWTCMVLLCVISSYSLTSQPSPPRLPLQPVHAGGVSGGVLSLHPVEYQVPWNKCKGTVQVQSHLQCSEHCQASVPPAHRGPGGPNWSGHQCDHHTHLD